jgi:hypothetical protein
MFEGWQDYYLLIGTAAAALIGLLFVVVTLTRGRELDSIERGQKLYMTPILFHLGGILLLSGLGMSPVVTPELFGTANGIVALMGFVACVRIARGIHQRPVSPTTDYDMWWYGIIPAGAYVVLLTASAALARWPTEWTLATVAAMLMTQLLISIHSAWDLVTYLAPRSSDQLSGSPDKKEP